MLLRKHSGFLFKNPQNCLLSQLQLHLAGVVRTTRTPIKILCINSYILSVTALKNPDLLLKTVQPLKEHQKRETKDVFSDTWNNFKYLHIFRNDETFKENVKKKMASTDDFKNPEKVLHASLHSLKNTQPVVERLRHPHTDTALDAFKDTWNSRIFPPTLLKIKLKRFCSDFS